MQPTSIPRVALFTDSYYEANGVARTATSLEAFAHDRDRPMLIVHGGPVTQLVETGSIVRLELARSNWSSFPLEHDLRFDAALWRHARQVARVLRWFRPDVLHYTGPSDIGQIGALLGFRQQIPMVASWHTNVHEYASRRLQPYLGGVPARVSGRLTATVERQMLAMTLMFYTLPRVLLAPNAEWRRALEARTRKQAFVMTRGVDTMHFTPFRRSRHDVAVNIGYVGRLSTEKSVRTLVELQEALHAAGVTNARFTIVGDGAERVWLESHLQNAEFTGVLRGSQLAEAYANFDLFVFPSETETVGNVVLEAMASGVPVIAMARGGTKFIAADTEGALLAIDQDELVRLTVDLARDRERRVRMSAAARETALTRSWPAVFDVVYHAYDAALAPVNRDEQPLEGAVASIPVKQSA